MTKIYYMSNAGKSNIARKYRTNYPDLPTLKLSRIMYRENNLAFTDLENARSALRYIEGKSGKKNKKGVGEKKFIVEQNRLLNPYKLPQSDPFDFEPYFIVGKDKILLINDLHVPFHDVSAITAMIKHCKNQGIKKIVLNGDLFDFYAISFFMKDPMKKRVSEEINIGLDLCKRISDEVGAPIIFKYGNHDERYTHWLWQKAGEISDIEETQLEFIIKNRYPDKIEIVKDKRIIQANSLNIIHGHEFGKSFFSPVNAARGLYLRGKTSAIQGHLHVSSEHTESDMNSKITTTWSVGCLCQLHPQYLPINKWNHGFSIIDLHEDEEDFFVENRRIHNGKVL